MEDFGGKATLPAQHLKTVRSVLLFLAAVSQFSLGPPAFGQSDTASLWRDYEAGNYMRVLSECDKLLEKDPRNATLHYYRANTCAKMGLESDAKSEYRNVLKLTRDPRLQQYCQSALAAYQNPGSAQTGAVPAGPFPTAINQAAAAPAAPSLIEQQADLLSLGHLSQASAAQSKFFRISQQVQAMKQSADANATAMANQRWYDKYGNSYPTYTQQQIDAARQKGYDDAADLLNQAKFQSEAAMSLAKQKAYITQESAAAIQSQLDAPRTGSVHLIKQGTGLFVRNYAADPQPAKVNPAQAIVPDDEGLAATQKALTTSSPSPLQAKQQNAVKTEVEGKLLKSAPQ